MSKIYLVTEGEYSDYHVVAAFTNRERAEEYKDAVMASNVEEYDLDPTDDQTRHPEGYKGWRIGMDKEGKVPYSDRIDIRQVQGERDAPVPWGEGNVYFFTVAAANEEHAIKIANERRRQLIAENEWCVNYEQWAAKNLPKPAPPMTPEDFERECDELAGTT